MGKRFCSICLVIAFILTGCGGNALQVSNKQRPGNIQQPNDSLEEPNFLEESWDRAWTLQKAKWGINGLAYIEGFSLETQDNKRVGINLTVLAEKDGKWQIFRHNRSPFYPYQDYEGAPTDKPDLTPLVEGDRFFQELEGIPLEDFYFPSAEYGHIFLEVSVEDGFLFTPQDHVDSYVVGGGRREKVTRETSFNIDGRNIIVHASPMGQHKPDTKEELNRYYLLKEISGSLERVSGPIIEEKFNQEVIAVKKTDIDGDSVKENVVLWGSKSSPDIPNCDIYELEISGDKFPRQSFNPSLDNAYQGVELTLRDLTGDGIPEIIFQEFVGGSGGIVFLKVYGLERKKLFPIFSGESVSDLKGVSNEYLGKNRVRVSIAPLKLSWEYELKLSNYDIGNAEQEQAIKEQFAPSWVDPFSSYEFRDLEGDGMIEIMGSQVICGTAHVDVVGKFKQLFAYDGTEFKLQNIELYRYIPFGEEKIRPVK